MNNIHPRPDTQPTSLSLKEEQDYYKALLRPVFVNRKFLHAGEVAVGLGDQARMLAALGAARPFLLAGSEGTGRRPTPAEAELRVLNVRGIDILDQHHQSEAALQHLTPEVQAAVEAWDPEGEARWLCRIMLSEVATVAGKTQIRFPGAILDSVRRQNCHRRVLGQYRCNSSTVTNCSSRTYRVDISGNGAGSRLGYSMGSRYAQRHQWRWRWIALGAGRERWQCCHRVFQEFRSSRSRHAVP